MITYTFKIKPNITQTNLFEKYLDITRLVYNIAKETKEYAYSKGIKLGCYDLINQLPDLKKEFNFIKTVSSDTLQGTIERLDKGYSKFYSCLKRGEKSSIPKWAKKKNWSSFEFKQTPSKILRFESDGKFNLPKIGKIKISKSREINGNIKLARILKKVDGWYLQVVTDYEIQKCDNQAEVGIDLGIKHFVVTSDGQFFENIKTTKKYADKLAKAQRKLALKKKGSNNFYREVEKVKRIYLKIQRVREDYLHKVSRDLANNYQYVFAEDLNIQEMVKNKLYSKNIYDVSWSKFTEYLNYKTNIIKVDPAYSSQECSNCGHTCKENRKTQENFKCVKCEHEGNADFEASLTIKKRGQSLIRETEVLKKSSKEELSRARNDIKQ